MILGKQQFRGDDIFADFADMLPGEDRFINFDAAFTEGMDLLDHNHGVRSAGHDMAGVDINGIPADFKLDRPGSACSESGLCFNGNAVHCRRVKVRCG